MTKRKPKSEHKTNGRPPKMTKDVVKKLEEGFAMGFSDAEACLYADISKPTLYNYCEDNPGFTDRKELLKDTPRMNAKAVVVSKINEKDDYNSRWYLEKKASDEFNSKIINENTNTNLNVEVEDQAELDKLLDTNGLM